MAAVPAEAEKAGAAYNVGPGEIAFQYENDNRIQKAGNPEAGAGRDRPGERRELIRPHRLRPAEAVNLGKQIRL